MKANSPVVAVAGLFLASLIGLESFQLLRNKSLPESVVPNSNLQTSLRPTPRRATDSLCQGELAGEFYDGIGNTFPVSLRFQAKVKTIKEKLTEEGLNILNGQANLIADWTHIWPKGYKRLTGLGSTDSVRVAKGRVDQISMNLEQPGSLFAGQLSISTTYNAGGKAMMNLRGMDGSSADLRGTSSCEEI